MKIYVASSWRNPWQPEVVKFLRSARHEVYDFRNPGPGEKGFAWSEIDPDWRDWTPESYRRALYTPVADRGFGLDMNALEACEACVLVLPCGNSAHLELGYAVGAKKKTAVLFPQGFDLTPIGGHSVNSNVTCSACGDLDGCHLPGKLRRFEPELMARMANNVLLDKLELERWLTR
jgi:hypothetical protein